LPYEEDAIKQSWKIGSFLKGRTGVDALKQLHFTPTATICGLTSGWQGIGTKTVLPAEATAKVDFRLVPDLTPDIVADLLRKHLDRHGFNDVEIVSYNGYRAEFCDVEAGIVKAATRAAHRIYQQEPILVPNSPGSGPMWSLSTFIGGVPVVCAGISHADNRVHSPNENVPVQNYYDGMRYIGALIEEFASA
jgi:acetylornithine deacetylase/succinyl-diaminopimelate desuccinylase-like protein